VLDQEFVLDLLTPIERIEFVPGLERSPDRLPAYVDVAPEEAANLFYY